MASQAEPLGGARGGAQPRALSIWLFVVATLVFAMVVVGGITRLTESGLSIVSWDVVSGTLPPLNAADWQVQFDAYRRSPEYLEVNRGMSLDEFKAIFFWEYVHRLLGRVIGLAFALPLLWFALRRAIPRGYAARLVILLALGALQGAIGWWMVASGLVDQPDVSHIRLAIHLLTALLILALLVWTALDLRDFARQPHQPQARMPTVGIWALSVLAAQILFGAYVAGLDAGFAFNTWPKMGEDWFPAGAPMLEPAIRNLVDNPLVVQFVHRWLAFVTLAALALLARAAWLAGHKDHAVLLIAAAILQIQLGIATLLSGVELWLGVGHQAVAALLLASAVATAHRLGRRAL